MTLVIWLHVIGGALGIVSGFAALAFRKGQRLHRAAGSVFAAAMSLMTISGAAMAVANGQKLNILAAALTFYLVATGWMTVRRPELRSGRIEIVLAILGGGVVAMAVAFAVMSLARGGGGRGFSALPLYLIFGALAGLGVVRDLRGLRSGGLAGRARLTRHLWRMLTALAIAALSFFIGQADEIPATLRGPHLTVPPLAVVALLAVWLVRVRFPPFSQLAPSGAGASPLPPSARSGA